MSTNYHMGLSVEGALAWSPRECRDALQWLTHDDGTPFGSVEELKDALQALQAEGVKVTKQPDCDHWDPARGCLGHPAEPGKVAADA